MIKFPKFDRFACEGDSVTVECEGFTLRATIDRDDSSGSPEEMQSFNIEIKESL